MKQANILKNLRPVSASLCEEDLSNISIANQYAISDGQSDSEYVNVYDSFSTTRDDSKISDANPEPDSSTEKSDEECSTNNNNKHLYSTQKDQYNTLLTKFKYQRGIYACIGIGLGIALLGSLIGLIIVNVLTKKMLTVNRFAENEINYNNTVEIEDPLRVHEFPTVSNKDSDIAQAFADHSLYQSFYGIKYTGPVSNFGVNLQDSKAVIVRRGYDQLRENYGNSSYTTQHQISLDMALLSRLTPRIRLIHDSSRLVERVIQAVMDLNLNLRLHLSIEASSWRDQEYNIRELINSSPPNIISAIYIERDADEETVYSAYEELNKFLQRRDLSKLIKTTIVTSERSQANPLELTEDPGVAIRWINNDQSRNLYTNLETPSETSERARYMTAWICQVVPNLRTNIEWFWSNAFDDNSSVTSGIFTADRKLKPAGLPRCNKLSI